MREMKIDFILKSKMTFNSRVKRLVANPKFCRCRDAAINTGAVSPQCRPPVGQSIGLSPPRSFGCSHRPGQAQARPGARLQNSHRRLTPSRTKRTRHGRAGASPEATLHVPHRLGFPAERLDRFPFYVLTPRPGDTSTSGQLIWLVDLTP
jgi:hypothetical protein